MKVGDTGITVHGIGDTFISPGSILNSEGTDGSPPWSFVVGVVREFENATLSFGNEKYEVIIAQLDTAIGVLPTIMGKEVFDVRDIAVGKLIGMEAYIKANFSSGDYPKSQPDKTQEDEPKKRRGWFGRR